MNTKSGILDVSEITEFAQENQIIPCGRNRKFREYTKLCDKLTIDIPETSGWYFWVNFKRAKLENPIYIGKADKTNKKNSLRYRINYELKTERICFWTDVVGKDKAFNDHHDFFDGKYDKGAERAQRKTGTKFIIWISDSEAT